MSNENSLPMNSERRRWYNLVQGLTFFRAMCGIAAVIVAGQGNYPLSVGFFALGLATDFEGSIARAKNVTTRMGALRDLIADDCLYIGGFIAPIMITITQESNKINDIPGIIPVGVALLSSIILPFMAKDELKETFRRWKSQTQE